MKVSAPTPPPSLGPYAHILAQGLEEETLPRFAGRDALDQLRHRDALRTFTRAWEAEWGHHEARLVGAARDAGVADAEVARALGVTRQNFQRKHGRRREHVGG